jgi:hypothetical protein
LFPLEITNRSWLNNRTISHSLVESLSDPTGVGWVSVSTAT